MLYGSDRLCVCGSTPQEEVSEVLREKAEELQEMALEKYKVLQKEATDRASDALNLPALNHVPWLMAFVFPSCGLLLFFAIYPPNNQGVFEYDPVSIGCLTVFCGMVSLEVVRVAGQGWLTSFCQQIGTDSRVMADFPYDTRYSGQLVPEFWLEQSKKIRLSRRWLWPSPSD
jgi:hypothetical protein